MRGGDTLEVVTLHNTGKTFTLAGAHDVNQLTGFKYISGDLLAYFVGVGIGGANLGHVTTGRNACLFEVTLQRRSDLTRVNGTGGNLDGFIAIVVHRANLSYHVGGNRHHGDRNHPILVIPHLSHTELDAQYASRCCHC